MSETDPDPVTDEIFDAAYQLMLQRSSHILGPDTLRAILGPAIRAAVEAEREACAKIADGKVVEQHYRSWPCWNPNGNLDNERAETRLADAIAATIRARSQKEPKA